MTDETVTAQRPTSRPRSRTPSGSAKRYATRRRTRPCACASFATSSPLEHRPSGRVGPDGSTRAKTEAAKLHRDLTGSREPAALVAAQRTGRGRQGGHRQARRRALHRGPSDRLILDLKPGRDAEDQLIIDKISSSTRCSRTGSSSPSTSRVVGARTGARRRQGDPQRRRHGRAPQDDPQFLAAGLRPTLPLSICTPEGQTPPRVKTASGQWIGIQHAHDIDQHSERKREEQEERDRHGRRRVQIHPPQPQPTGRSPLDETLSALLGD